MIISEQGAKIDGAYSVTNIMQNILAFEHETDQVREHFWVIGLNAVNVIQYIELASLGTLTQALVHPREIFRLAIMKGVAAIILCHNHPSGNFTPSQKDVEITRRLSNAGQILGIKLWIM